MVQQIIILLLFIVAVAYMVRMLYRTFSSKAEGCAKSCGACGGIDFKKIEQEMERRKKAALPNV
ncbi:FeoB-associated Cys-rich membrane protein [Pontibacter fetidus]|uniref:FeoB-associated Cys-rich membrane protein n=1 Tax=Pontibacter fetidus TaxID=2700082 RepID=A0A6B2GVQ8_9BACT|nr:FeoB-associated Cys-rich membrane protein [Pontibacter fetidus]NDK54895.1 FeoB-associated Cys-rich membrane protein [Pontibacter fetidus]